MRENLLLQERKSTSATANNLSQSPRRCLKTKDDNDCAFHAVLGVWNEEEQQVICAEAKQRRTEVKRAIEESKAGSRIRELAVAGIKELIMAGRTIGEESRKLLNAHQQFLADQNTLSPQLWQAFEVALRKSPDAMQYIAGHHQHPRGALASLRDQFYDALNRNEGDLYAIIRSLTDLDAAFKHYNELDQTRYDWEGAVSSEVIAEYAQFVGRPGQWLLQSEVAILAEVFRITVEYYSAPGAKVEIFNPGQQRKVAVQFNGTNHFEQMCLMAQQADKKEEKKSDQFPAAVAFKFAVSFSELEKVVERLADKAVIKPILTKIQKEMQEIESFFPIQDRSLYYPQIREGLEAIGRLLGQIPPQTGFYHSIRDRIKKTVTPLQNEVNAFFLQEDGISDAQLLAKTQALYAQQALIMQDDSIRKALSDTLDTIKQELPDARRGLRCFISYAWPTAARQQEEYWLQPFLRVLHVHLRQTGIKPLLDIADNQPGANIVTFTNQIKDFEFALLFCTDSLADKHNEPRFKVVQTELSLLRQKYDLDIATGQVRVLPFIVSGSRIGALLPEHHLYRTVRDWRNLSYVKNIEQLIGWICYPQGAPEAYQKTWQNFYAKYPALASPMPEDHVKQELALQWHTLEKDKLEKETFYQGLLTQHSSFVSSSPKAGETIAPVDKVIERENLDIEVKVQNHLKALYKNITIETSFNGSIPLGELYTPIKLMKKSYEKNLDINLNLKMLARRRREQMHLQQEVIFGRDSMKRAFIEPENMFQGCRNNSRRVLIIAASGFGKSVYCNSLAWKWAMTSLWAEEYRIVLAIKLCNLTERRYPKKTDNAPYSLLEVLKNELQLNFIKEEHLLQFAKTNLWLLDGYDELPKPLPLQLEEVIHQLLDMPHFILTSSPGEVYPVKHDMTLELMGFDNIQVQAYCKRFFDRMSPSEREKRDIRGLRTLIQTNVSVKTWARIPALLEIICSVWCNRSFNPQNAHSLTTLYQQVLLWLLRQSGNSHKPEEKGLLAEILESEYSQQLQLLECLAFEAMRQKKRIIDPGLISTVMKKYRLFKDAKEWTPAFENMLRLKLIKHLDDQFDSQQPLERHYFFLHFTFQEFFAARYLYRQLQVNKEIPAWIIFHKYDDIYTTMLSFTAGLLSMNPENTENKAIKSFWSALDSSPRDITGQRHFQIQLQCLEQTHGDSHVPPKRDILILLANFLLKLKNVATGKSDDPILQDPSLPLLRDCPYLLNSPEAQTFFLSIIGKSNEPIKRDIIEFLDTIGPAILSEKIITSLVGKLDSKYEEAKQTAATVIKKFGLAAATRKIQLALFENFERGDWYVQSIMLDSLRNIGNELIPEVIEGLRKYKDRNGSIINILSSLEETSEEEHNFSPKINQFDVGLSDKLFFPQGPKELADKPAEYWIDKLHGEDRRIYHEALRNLVNLSPDEVTDQVLNAVLLLLKDKDSHMVDSAITALRKFGPIAVSQDLLSILLDKKPFSESEESYEARSILSTTRSLKGPKFYEAMSIFSISSLIQNQLCRPNPKQLEVILFLIFKRNSSIMAVQQGIIVDEEEGTKYIAINKEQQPLGISLIHALAKEGQKNGFPCRDYKTWKELPIFPPDENVEFEHAIPLKLLSISFSRRASLPLLQSSLEKNISPKHRRRESEPFSLIPELDASPNNSFQDAIRDRTAPNLKNYTIIRGAPDQESSIGGEAKKVSASPTEEVAADQQLSSSALNILLGTAISSQLPAPHAQFFPPPIASDGAKGKKPTDQKSEGTSSSDIKKQAQRQRLLRKVCELLDKVYPPDDRNHTEARKTYLQELKKYHELNYIFTAEDEIAIEGIRTRLLQQQSENNQPGGCVVS